MEHITIFYYLFSFIIGCISIGISLFVYKIYKKRVIIYYSLFLSSLSLILFSLLLNRYLYIIPKYVPMLDVLSTIFHLMGIIAFLLFAPYFFYKLIGQEMKKYKKIIFYSIVITGFVLNCLTLFGFGNMFIFIFGLSLFYGEYGYFLIFSAINLKNIGDITLKKALFIFFIISLLFFPIILFEILRTNIFHIYDLKFFELLALPSYFLIINTLSIVFTIKHFNRPPFFNNNILTKHFKNTYRITERETEIIEMLIQGHSYNQIGEKLFIAYKTVDNHVSNIYKKTLVKSRIQLLNLIITNSLS